MTTVEMHPAYQWDCPDCGRENFERGLVPEMSDEDAQEILEEMGIEPGDEGCIMVMPPDVQCRHCGGTFETERDR